MFRTINLGQNYKSGVRSQELGVRSQELGVRSQELGVRSQELGVRSQERKTTHYPLLCAIAPRCANITCYLLLITNYLTTNCAAELKD